MSIAGELAKALFPPRGANEDDVFRWRIFVAVLLWGHIMGSTIFVLMAFGALQLLGFTGFATKAEAQETQQLLKEIRISQVENQLRDYRMQQCQAQVEGNGLALTAATENLRRMGNIYYSLTKRLYVPDSCDALLVMRATNLSPRQ